MWSSITNVSTRSLFSSVSSIRQSQSQSQSQSNTNTSVPAATTSASDTTTTSITAWKQAFTTSLLTLGEEKVDPTLATHVANRSLTESTLSGGLNRHNQNAVKSVPYAHAYGEQDYLDGSIPNRSTTYGSSHPEQRRQQFDVPNNGLKDSFSVITFDEDAPNADTAPDDDRLLLQQKEEILTELLNVSEVQTQALREARQKLTELQMKYKQQELQWSMSIEDLQSQKTVLQERLGVMNDDMENTHLIEQLTSLIQAQAPQELFSQSNRALGTHRYSQGRLGHFLNNANHQNSEVVNEKKSGQDNFELEDDHDNAGDDMASKITAGSVHSSGFRSRWGLGSQSPTQDPSNRKTLLQQKQQLQELQDYATLLQTQLIESMQKSTILANQISTMEQAHEDQVSKVIHSIRETEMERIRIQVESDAKLQVVLHEKKMTEQALLSKLDVKNEKIRRLEDYVEELRDTAVSMKAHQHRLLDSAVLTTDIGKRFQDEKARMAQQHRREMERLRAEVKKLNCKNDELERHVERLKVFETLSKDEPIEDEFWAEEFHSKAWSSVRDVTTPAVEGECPSLSTPPTPKSESHAPEIE